MSAELTKAANELNGEKRRPRNIVTAASFVLPELKIAYVTNLKVACSTMKWLLAELSNQDPNRFYSSIGKRPSRAQTVHDRDLWENVHPLGDFDLAEISPDNGWLVFTLVRDPRARLWSAWQSKLLTGNPGYLGPVVREPWYPRLPQNAAEVLEDFQKFIESLATEGRQMRRIGRDGHFRPQSDLVYRKGLKYSHVYDLSDVASFERDLAAHLVTVGYNELPALHNDNDTPLAMTKDVLAGGVAEAIEDIFGEDFDRFGSAWEEGPTVREVTWSDSVFTDIAFRRAAHQRIRDLSEWANQLLDENARIRGEVD